MKPTLLVLAAGMGSRFGGLKQMEPVGPSGEWILDYSVYDAAKAGFGKVVFVIRKEMEELFRPTVEAKYASLIQVEIAFQESDDLPIELSSDHRLKPWGTGHAVYAAREKLDTPFAVINADDFYGKEAYETLSTFLTAERPQNETQQYALVGYNLSKTLSPNGTVSRGVCLSSDDDELITVEEHTEIGRRDEDHQIQGKSSDDQSVELDGETPVSLNCWAFPTEFLSKLESLFTAFLHEHGHEPKTEFYLPFAVDELIKSKQATAKVLRCDADWLGVTHREDLEHVQSRVSSLVNSGVYQSPLA